MSVLHGYNSAGKTTGRMSCPLMLHESRFCEQQFVSEVQPSYWVSNAGAFM